MQGTSSRSGWPRRSISGGLASASVLLLVGVLLRGLGGPGMGTRIALFSISLLVVLALQMFTGNSGVTSFGHIAFMALGAYGSALLTIPSPIKSTALRSLPPIVAEHQLPFVAALAIAVGFVALVAFLVGLPLSRLTGSAGAIATFAFLVVVNVVIAGMTGVTGGRRALYGVPRVTNATWALGFAVTGVLVTRLFRDSPLGLRLRASREDEVVAQAMGVRVANSRLVAWILSATLAGISGVLYAHLLGAFSAQQFYLGLTITTLAMLIVGGMTTVSGAIAGTAVLYAASEALREVEASAGLFGLSQITIALVLLIMMYFRPQGLLGELEADEHLLLRRLRRSLDRPGASVPSHSEG
ncbi:MAG TPA: branched-chain amino acid ABC transporter permease [Actinomycetota bacterium]|nr:branched-chain amino acid ABC transporter permease [Actinomycetota bacterium]